jgi:hypothetical protein
MASTARCDPPRPDAPFEAERLVSLRCNAPQRTPRAPATVWGSPRGRLGWSLRELASRTGINAGELSRIERGRSCPSPDQALRLLRAFGMAS